MGFLRSIVFLSAFAFILTFAQQSEVESKTMASLEQQSGTKPDIQGETSPPPVPVAPKNNGPEPVEAVPPSAVSSAPEATFSHGKGVSSLTSNFLIIFTSNLLFFIFIKNIA